MRPVRSEERKAFVSKEKGQVKIPEMVVFMKQTVPEFKSKNSVYEKYDKKE